MSAGAAGDGQKPASIPKPASGPVPARRGTHRVALIAGAAAVGMLALSFAAVPLYQTFCRMTGYGGTTQVAAQAPGVSGQRIITVRFNADTAPDLQWRFRPMQRMVEMRLGEQKLASFSAENRADRAVTGVAAFNVTPNKAGRYFDKVACFCFDAQTLQPGQKVEMPVSFFIDPAIEHDRNLDDVTTITLSYTFFLAPEQPVGTSADQPPRRQAALAEPGGSLLADAAPFIDNANAGSWE